MLRTTEQGRVRDPEIWVPQGTSGVDAATIKNDTAPNDSVLRANNCRLLPCVKRPGGVTIVVDEREASWR